MDGIRDNKEGFVYSYKRKRTREDPHTTTFHAHSGVEFLYIHEGKGTLILDRQTIAITGGTICCFQPFQLHHIKYDVNEEPNVTRSFFLFEPSMYEPFFEKMPALQTFFYHICQDELSVKCLEVKEAEDLIRVFSTHLQMAGEAPEVERRERHAVFLLQFFSYLKPIWSLHEQTSAPRRRTSHISEKIMDWLELHYTEPFRLEPLSEAMYLSPHHLSHLFKEATGRSISQYIKARRIRQACLLLAVQPPLPITEIADRTGFGDSAYFCKIFKEAFGVSPHQFRLKPR